MAALSLLLAAPLLLQSDETVKDFKSIYRKEKDVLMKVELIHSLEGIDHPDVAKALVKVLVDDEPQLAAAALEVVTALPSAEARAPLYGVLEAGKPKDQVPVILRAAAEGGWEEFAPVVRPFLEAKDPAAKVWYRRMDQVGASIHDNLETAKAELVAILTDD